MTTTLAPVRLRSARDRLARTVHVRALRILAAVLLAIFSPTAARAQTPDATPPPPPDSLVGQLVTLSHLLQPPGEHPPCTERCFTLDRLRLTGSLAAGTVQFELAGHVLWTHGAVDIPLFGPPDKVRLDAVTQDARPAVLGFVDGHYFLHTDARAFVLRGSLSFGEERVLEIPGPLNLFVSEIADATVAEGTRLSGLSSASLHFGSRAATEPTVQQESPMLFQIARAVRIGRENEFEYRLTLRSGRDLGVVRLPLPFHERVLDVSGSTGWRTEGAELILPTTGSNAEITVRGSLGDIPAFAPDPRSSYEWWLVESDPERQLTFDTPARAVDPRQSPIPATQPTAKLHMVQRGQSLHVTVTTLATSDVLAAVVRNFQRTVVLTAQHELVCDDHVQYENNGIDYLRFVTAGRASFVGTDGTGERILRAPDGPDLMIPLRTGPHAVQVQSRDQWSASLLGGRWEVPSPRIALNSGITHMAVGLPASVHPLAAFGGDRPWFAYDTGDAFVVFLGLLWAWAVFRTLRDRLLAMCMMAGLGIWAPALVVVIVVGSVLALGTFLASRLLRGALRWMLLVAGGGGVVLAMLALGTAMLSRGSSDMERVAQEYPSAPPMPSAAAPAQLPRRSMAQQLQNAANLRADTDARSESGGGEDGAGAAAGFAQGATPVPENVPGYARRVDLSRQSVSPGRPFRMTLWYVTDWVVIPMQLLWLAVLLALTWSRREWYVRLRAWSLGRWQEATAPRAAAEPVPPPPPSPPPAAPEP